MKPLRNFHYVKKNSIMFLSISQDIGNNYDRGVSDGHQKTDFCFLFSRSQKTSTFSSTQPCDIIRTAALQIREFLFALFLVFTLFLRFNFFY